MQDMNKLKELLGRRLEAVLRSSPDQQEAMNQLAERAQQVDLVDSQNNLSRDDPLSFVSDLWYDNPRVLNRLGLYQDSLPSPLKVQDLSQALELLK